ncbi:hypothetical protein B0T16DRAFT_323245 [Cercophora newfieldiana]|uniref:Zn(2)-C6 fungal-type domain-containing protein n=1 Tax=Cercophora newfieldiana TaxID=92897 RepID=A0AA39YI59_9PEZI|nr:hypothetical protein B0T16DRAFT_323245 [Cercophora newfieldiana]
MASGSKPPFTAVVIAPKQLQPKPPQQRPQQPQLAPQNAGPHRRILPAGPPPREGPNGDVALRGGSRSKIVVPPKNVHVKGACDGCRTRKIKCSGSRPKCVACERSGATCNYAAGPSETHSQALKRKFGQLQEKSSIYEELCQLICKMPDNESTEIVRRLRAGDDVSTIVRQVKAGCLLLQLALSPESRFRYSFPYVPDMPVALRSPDNPYVGSSLFEASYSSSPSPRPEDLPEDSRCTYTKPYHVAEVVDVRFSKIHASRWTYVIDDDTLFRNLLRAYILHEHTTYPYIHIDSFMDGLASGDERFCSSLMVNVMMASACHCYQALPDRHKFWKPKSLGYQFLSEARRLWELEIKSGTPALTTVMAGILLNTEYNHNGMDSLGYTFLEQSLAMADHIGLFDPEVHRKIEDKRTRDLWEFCSWGLFVWSTVQCYYFYRKPLINIPVTPLPDPKQHPSWYGEVHLLYPVSPAPISAGHGYTIKANADLHVILHHTSLRAFHDGQSTLKLRWEEAMEFKRMLDDWFNNLPESLSPKSVVFPWHLKLHTMYYTAIHILFSSLIAPDALPSIATLTSLPPDVPISTAGEISGRAVMRLETVIRLYYLRHSFSFCDSFLVYFLSILARATLETMGTFTHKPVLDPQQIRILRSTVLLCMKGMNEQGQNNYIAEVVYRLIKSTLSPQDLDALQANVNLVELSEDDLFTAKQCRSQWPMPGIKVYDNPRDAAVDKSLDRLVKKYNEMTLEEDSERRRRESRRVEELE